MSQVQLDIAALYKKYGGLVHRRAMRFFDEEEAQDVVHEVFLQVMKHQGSFRGEAAPSTWLYKVTTNLCIKRLNKRTRRQALWMEHRMDLIAPGIQSSNQEAAAMLTEIWDKLPEELATLGLYRYGDGLSQEEIGGLMGLSRKTINKRLKELKGIIGKMTGV